METKANGVHRASAKYCTIFVYYLFVRDEPSSHTYGLYTYACFASQANTQATSVQPLKVLLLVAPLSMATKPNWFFTTSKLHEAHQKHFPYQKAAGPTGHSTDKDL